ncbi:MAG TPA: hypothetical protein VE933_05805 [Chitinophagaceae bacterium]|nr:hypothetical protein [Chitinophagaceae bacterium]
MSKEIRIVIRVSDLEKAGFERAAEVAGISISAWSRERLRAAAIMELQDVGEKIPFLKPIKLKKSDERE